MTDLLTRLAARTLASAPGLRPAAVPRFVPVVEEEDDGGGSVLAPARSLPDDARPTKETTGADVRIPAPRRGMNIPPSAPREAESRRRVRQARVDDARWVPTNPAVGAEPPPTPSSSAAAPGKAAAGEAATSPRPAWRPPPAIEPGERELLPRAPEAPPRPPETPSPRRPEAWDDPPLVRQPSLNENREPSILPATARSAFPGRAEEPREETTVHVSIGRIEVRAREQQAPVAGPPPWTEGPILNLHDYLRRRGGSS